MTTEAILPTESRPRLRRVVAAAWLTLVSLIALIDHIALSRLSTEVRPYGSEVSAVTLRLLELDHQLDTMANEPASISEARFAAAQQASEGRLAQLEQAIGSAALREEIAPLQDRLTALEQRSASFRQRATSASRERQTPEPGSKTLPAVAVPPFTMLGMEERGGISFLAVAPAGADSLAQVHLVREGESYGEWRLHKLTDIAAEFRLGDRSILLEIPKRNER